MVCKLYASAQYRLCRTIHDSAILKFCILFNYWLTLLCSVVVAGQRMGNLGTATVRFYTRTCVIASSCLLLGVDNVTTLSALLFSVHWTYRLQQQRHSQFPFLTFMMIQKQPIIGFSCSCTQSQCKIYSSEKFFTCCKIQSLQTSYWTWYSINEQYME